MTSAVAQGNNCRPNVNICFLQEHSYDGFGFPIVTGHRAPKAMHMTPTIPTVAAHGGAKELNAHDMRSNKSPSPTNKYCILSIVSPELMDSQRV